MKIRLISLLAALMFMLNLSQSIAQTEHPDYAIIYLHRLAKSTQSDITFKIWLDDAKVSELKGMKSAVSTKYSDSWIVFRCDKQGKVVLKLTYGKKDELKAKAAVEVKPGRKYYVDFNTAAAYGENPLTMLDRSKGHQLFAEAEMKTVEIATENIRPVVIACKNQEYVDEDVALLNANDRKVSSGNETKQEEKKAAGTENTETINSIENKATILATADLSGVGKYYALIIAIDEYDDPEINDLDKPVRDAQKMYEVVTSQYTFDDENVFFLKNPTYEQMIVSLDNLSDIVREIDNVLIFYAGHGYWDEEKKIGYWLPADARRSNTANWFRNSTLKDYIGAIQSKHTLLIADACFSGGIFKTRAAFSDAAKDGIQKLYDLPSRKAMTSGTLTEVPDESVFLLYLSKRLTENDSPFLSSEELFSSFRSAVLANSPNVPQFGEIKDVGDEGGDFIFIKREKK
ncbi:MAG: caspase family protein [Bacteroidetes bacterium]|nr:caspase family protein [Bacteroidota bacterium]MBU1720473.1 caspase family protein [Bacteroidota bacterium]